MPHTDVPDLSDRALERLDEGRPAIGTLDWLYNEIGTIARARDDVDLTYTTMTLFLASHFYKKLLDEKLVDEYQSRVRSADCLHAPDEEILFSILLNQSLDDFFEGGDIETGQFNRLLKQALREEELQIDHERFTDLTFELRRHLEKSYESVEDDLLNDDDYGIRGAIHAIGDASASEDEQIVDTSLSVLLDIHIEYQGFPNLDR